MKPVITVRDLTRQFGTFTAVDHISFEVHPGEIFGFLGANGAGKTTAMKMLIGILRPSSGEASVAGFDVYREAEHIKQHIGYMSQRFSLYEDLTVMENIRFYAGIYGLPITSIRKEAKALLDRLELTHEANTLVKA
ncbi:MAG TPA: ABC transporter ATP-binding protein, partial [Bacteroidetes bacterium]|nr:ABC transporter ATP-binding protein [Bacteroidota bacterium]